MNTRLNVLALTSAALLLGMGWTGSTMAQQSGAEMPGSKLDRASCQEVDWHHNLLRDYPWVVEACHEAIVVDGKKWARFQAEFQQVNRDGTITANFKNDRGRELGKVELMPGENQRVMLSDRPTRFSDLRRGQVLSFYVPEDMYAFTMEPGAPASEVIQIVEPPAAQPSRQLAQVEPTTTRRPATLPATAGPLPIIALGGLLSLLGGLTLTMRRRFKTPTA